ncbi:hypothetical protein ACE1TI_15435 [Alteribacillus sp. JSM 102045]|uniref:hypothetical protein n=1 Tax=Alteribacillus sp. JSM 102045 TaxID=1562101 RepID=UPI0035C01FB4
MESAPAGIPLLMGQGGSLTPKTELLQVVLWGSSIFVDIFFFMAPFIQQHSIEYSDILIMNAC